MTFKTLIAYSFSLATWGRSESGAGPTGFYWSL